MKNKKGFTLIELLAVIVILAIIALIATPIVLNMISSARKSAAKSAALGYIDAIEYNNGFVEIEQDGYTAVTSGEVATITSTLGSHLKGKAPTSGSVVIDSNGKVTSAANLCFNGYAVNYDGKDATVVGSCSSGGSTPSIPEPVSFATDSWETIANNTTSSVYEVGNEKELEIDVDENGTNETYHIVIINKTSCTNETSETACGLVLQFKEVLSITNNADMRMNLTSTNVGGWRDSKMRTYLNTTIYNKLPNDLKSKIINTTVISGHEPNVAQNYETIDKMYLLSPKEIGENAGECTDSDTSRKMDYYEDYSKRTKIQLGGNSSGWWLRSARNSTSYTNRFHAVASNGSGSFSDASNPLGVSPAFRIGVNQ